MKFWSSLNPSLTVKTTPVLTSLAARFSAAPGQILSAEIAESAV